MMRFLQMNPIKKEKNIILKHFDYLIERKAEQLGLSIKH